MTTATGTCAARYTAFDGHRLLVSGPMEAAALAVKHAAERGASGPLLIFDDSTGRTIDVDVRGSDDAVRARLASQFPTGDASGASSASTAPDPGASAHTAPGPASEANSRGRGRPKLGVIAREVTLLPRHWEWLAAQPGGASVALRKLVEEARRSHRREDARRQAQSSAYHFMSAMAGDMPGFEEATRALFAGERDRMRAIVAPWPQDVRDHALALAFGGDNAENADNADCAVRANVAKQP